MLWCAERLAGAPLLSVESHFGDDVCREARRLRDRNNNALLGSGFRIEQVFFLCRLAYNVSKS